ncbi:MAG: aldo/keto reductase [Anaerolineae bacterium]
MDYRYLGRTGLLVSELCLGAMTFGREADEETSFELLNRFIDAGGNFIDIADVYAAGKSEEIVGRWLKGRRREDYIIATKVRWPTGDRPNDVGLSRKHILDAVEASLDRLDTDYIDLYQMHGWDPGTPLEETLRTLDDLVQSGKVRYLGASNFTGYQLQKAIDLSRQNGWEVLSCHQPLYNLLDRTIEWEILPVCRAEGLGVIPWSPLRGGWLTGKYRRDMQGPPEGTRVEKAEQEGWGEAWSKYNTERTWRIIDAMMAISEEVGRTPAQVALNWLLNRPGVTAPITGVRKLVHLDDNLGAVGWSLEEAQLQRLNDASTPSYPYPYDIMVTEEAARGRGS